YTFDLRRLILDFYLLRLAAAVRGILQHLLYCKRSRKAEQSTGAEAERTVFAVGHYDNLIAFGINASQSLCRRCGQRANRLLLIRGQRLGSGHLFCNRPQNRCEIVIEEGRKVCITVLGQCSRETRRAEQRESRLAILHCAIYKCSTWSGD